MRTYTHRDDRERRSRQPIFAARVSAPEWPDMRVLYLHRDGSVDLVPAAAVTRMDERPLGLVIPANTTYYHLTAAEYAAEGFWLVE